MADYGRVDFSASQCGECYCLDHKFLAAIIVVSDDIFALIRQFSKLLPCLHFDFKHLVFSILIGFERSIEALLKLESKFGKPDACL